MQILMVANGNYLNRGCEAIVRGTVRILQAAFGRDTVCINAYNERLGRVSTNPQAIPGVQERPVFLPNGVARHCREVARKILPGPLYRTMQFSSLIGPLRASPVALSLGGDNFSLDYGLPIHHVEQNRFIHSQGKPVVIWGASVGPFDNTNQDVAEQLHRHLRDEVTAIFAREPETVAYLHRYGMGHKVRQVCDPAFAMEPEPLSDVELNYVLPSGAIGVNLSPLIAEKIAPSVDQRLQWAATVLDCLGQRCQRPLVLIPHVTLPWSDDHRFMAAAVRRCQMTQEVYLLPRTLNAAQTKFVIAQMDCLVAARTHATIAAFSTGVPTVSLAYSVKASGLNRQIFGHTDYVLSGNQLNGESIASLAGRLLAERDQIRAALASLRPTLRHQAFLAGQYLHELLTSVDTFYE